MNFKPILTESIILSRVIFCTLLLSVGCASNNDENKLTGPFAEIRLQPFLFPDKNLISTEQSPLELITDDDALDKSMQLARKLFLDETTIESVLKKSDDKSDATKIKYRAEHLSIAVDGSKFIQVRYHSTDAEFACQFLMELYKSAQVSFKVHEQNESSIILDKMNIQILEKKKKLEKLANEIEKMKDSALKNPVDHANSYNLALNEFEVLEKKFHLLIEKKTEFSIQKAGYVPFPFILVNKPAYHQQE
jgi:hypothetical protein